MATLLIRIGLNDVKSYSGKKLPQGVATELKVSIAAKTTLFFIFILLGF